MLPLTPDQPDPRARRTRRTTLARTTALALLAPLLVAAPALPATAVHPAAAHPAATLPAASAAAPAWSAALPATTATTDTTGTTEAETPGTPDAAANTVTWGLVPSGAEGPDGRVSLRFEAEPGQEFTDHVQVQNFSEQEITFALGASDGVVTEDGVFDILPAAEEPVDVGSWVEIAEEVTVPAQDTAVVPFTLRVPGDALPGDHPGGITASVSTTSSDDAGNAVSLDSRVGVRIHLRVAGELAPQVEIQDLTASYQGTWNPFARGELTLTWTTANTGNVRVGSVQNADVSGLFGLPAGAADGRIAEQREILPRQSARQSVTIPAWPVVNLTTDMTAVQNTVGEDVVEAELGDATATATTLAMPWPHLIILALLVLTVVLWRRSKKGRDKTLEAALAEAREAGRREAGGSTAATASTTPPPTGTATPPPTGTTTPPPTSTP